MEFATWAYPWDLRDEGVESVSSRLRGIGVDEVNLATNYHAIQAFSPHGAGQKTHFAEASSYFLPDDRYGDLRPTPYEGMDGDWVESITTAAEDLRLTSWTVGCHNSRLGMANPDVTLTSPYGDNLVFGLCPSNPAVQRYLTSVVGDLASREWFDRIELETFDYFYGTGFGWHHQKIHVELGTLGEFLFGLCFCEHCREHAATRGIDVEEAREATVEVLDDIISNGLSNDIIPEEWIRQHQPVADYVAARQDRLGDLYADLYAAADGTPLGYYVGTPEPGREWMAGVDLDRLSEYLDYVCLPAYESSREAVLRAYHRVKRHDPDVPVHVGLLPGYPEINDAETLSRIVEGLREEDVPRVSFYNYGLLPDRSLDWIEAAIR
ncbi:hypothetical protein EXE41_12780 [Halorubrum sp. SD690R]|uniref:hypothetical protein n=1 Tax=Halorubrum sp. SD690R TaxID=2518117 RepID=UPI0010F78302|nr:hypothetical protein [Halorubrum sp. SD690R]TKX44847.1 hypothetical protein EXE41_12780 [Halorubrum sp. SD690R]